MSQNYFKPLKVRKIVMLESSKSTRSSPQRKKERHEEASSSVGVKRSLQGSHESRSSKNARTKKRPGEENRDVFVKVLEKYREQMPIKTRKELLEDMCKATFEFKNTPPTSPEFGQGMSDEEEPPQMEFRDHERVVGKVINRDKKRQSGCIKLETLDPDRPEIVPVFAEDIQWKGTRELVIAVIVEFFVARNGGTDDGWRAGCHFQPLQGDAGRSAP